MTLLSFEIDVQMYLQNGISINIFFVAVLIRTVPYQNVSDAEHFSKVVYIEKQGGFSKVDISTVPYWVVVVPDRGDRGLFVVCTEEKKGICWRVGRIPISVLDLVAVK